MEPTTSWSVLRGVEGVCVYHGEGGAVRTSQIRLVATVHQTWVLMQPQLSWGPRDAFLALHPHIGDPRQPTDHTSKGPVPSQTLWIHALVVPRRHGGTYARFHASPLFVPVDSRLLPSNSRPLPAATGLQCRAHMTATDNGHAAD